MLITRASIDVTKPQINLGLMGPTKPASLDASGTVVSRAPDTP